MVVGATTLSIIAFNEISGEDPVTNSKEAGWDSLWAKYECSIPTDYKPANTTATGQDCGNIRDDYNHVIRDPVTGDMPWPGLFFGLTVISTWYWCTDQVIVQRTLAAKDLSNAKLGCVIAGFIKITPMFLIVMPGMIARILFTDEVACVEEENCKKYCDSSIACSNIAYPTLVLRVLPSGLRGMLMAVMLAALMSSLTSTFNSGATLFTLDIYNKIRSNASQVELMIVSRCTMLALCAISILWLPIVQSASDGLLFDYIQGITSYLGPPVVTVFTFGLFVPRANEPGAFWGLIVGLIVGLFRMINEFALPGPRCGEADARPLFILRIHYLYFALILTGLTSLVIIVVSLLTPPIPKKYLIRLTWWTRFSTAKAASFEDTSRQHKIARHEANPEKYEHPDKIGASQNDSNGCCGKWCSEKEVEQDEKEETKEMPAYDPIQAITEKPNWARAANAMAVTSVVVCCFLHGYFA